MMMRTFALLLLACPFALGDETHALAMAHADSLQLRAEDAIFTRYLYLPPHMSALHGEKESYQATRFALHLCSWGPAFETPALKDTFGNLLLRFNLKDLALDPTDPKEVDKLVETWELLQFDPMFNLLLTKDTLRFAAALGLSTEGGFKWELVKVPVYTATDGKRYDSRWVKKPAKGGEVEVIRIVAEHLDKKLVGELIDRTQSQAPIVSAPYFIARLRTIKDKDKVLWNTLYGGIYYDLAGIPANEKDLLAKLDATQSAAFDKLQPDRRAWILKSGVTKQERLVEAIPTRATSLERSPYFFVTRDRRRSSIDVGDSFRMNLFKGFFEKKAKTEDGGETYFAKQNGLPGMTISNDKRVFVEKVADDIASATNRPSHAITRELEAPMDCLSCHAANNGFQRVQDTLAGDLRAKRVTFIDDLEARQREAAIRRVENWADADFEAVDGILPRARNDFARGVMKVTGPWKGSKTKPEQLDIVRVASEKLFEVFAAATWDDIDAHRAFQELGVMDVKKVDAAATLKALLAPPFPTITDQRFSDLFQGRAIARTEFDLIRSILAIQLRRAKQ